MVIKTNRKDRTHFLYEKAAGVGIIMSAPVKNSKQGNRLTIRDNDTKESIVELNGRQIKALRAVLNKAAKLSSTL